MTPPTQSRPINLALVLALCALILSARFLIGYAHEETAVHVESSSAHHDQLPPLW
jgi:hypothetical protein